MSLVRCLSLRSGLNAQRYRSSYAFLIPLHTRPEEESKLQTPPIRSYHCFLPQTSLTDRSAWLSRNLSASHRSISTFNFAGSGASFESVGVLTDWVLRSAVSNAYALHSVADVLASLQHLIALLNAFTFSQWWVCIIVTSLLIRGVTIPVMIDLINSIVQFFKNLGSHSASAQGDALAKITFRDQFSVTVEE